MNNTLKKYLNEASNFMSDDTILEAAAVDKKAEAALFNKDLSVLPSHHPVLRSPAAMPLMLMWMPFFSRSSFWPARQRRTSSTCSRCSGSM